MVNRSFEHWGPLRERYATARPRKILALDGGGIRGVLTLEVLVEVEELLRARFANPKLVLADYFDYVAGTSTGGIIAAALAIGMDAKSVRDPCGCAPWTPSTPSPSSGTSASSLGSA